MINWLNVLSNDGKRLIEIYRMWENPEYLHEIINEIYEIIQKNNFEFDSIITVAATGSIFAAPIAYRLNKGLVLIRKQPKVNHDKIIERQFTNWRNESDSLSLDTMNFQTSKKFLFIDDIIQNNKTFQIASELIIESKNEITCCVVVANLSNEKYIGNVEIKSVIQFQ